MSLLDEGLARLQQKRTDRRRVKPPDAFEFATYQGKDPTDGTDKVAIGASEATSGFKLISNAPAKVGDRVSLRPNRQGGLQRVDARNVAPLVVVDNQGVSFLIGRCFEIRVNADVVYGGTRDNILVGGFSAASSTYADTGIFSLVYPDSYKNGVFIPFIGSVVSDRFQLPTVGIPSINKVFFNVSRSYNGSQWIDTCFLDTEGYSSFTITQTKITPIFFPFKIVDSFAEYETLDGIKIPFQNISVFSSLKKKTYSVSMYQNGSLAANGSGFVDWASPQTYDNLSVGGVLIDDVSTNLPISGLDFGDIYWSSSPTV